MSVPQIAAQVLNPAALFLPRGEATLTLSPPSQPSQPQAPAPVPLRLYFGEVPITETATFPPQPAAADAPECWVYVTLNAEIALSLPSSPWLRRLVHEPRARVSVDGQWLWWALRRKYPQQPLAKLAGSDLIHQLAEHAQREGRRLLLVGSTPQANGQAVLRLRQRWPGLQVAGYSPRHYALDSRGEARATGETLAAIEAWQADYVVLGLGASKEHRMAERIAPLLDGRVLGVCCFGGAIDMAGGLVRRAPVWAQRAGLEGPYRVWQQPARLLRFMRVLRLLPLLAARSY
jgi:N-acetylglucosaminyldiphosphoundecaprenol N-acetyl-beta-D-mannosaminyltransferase